MRRVRRNVDGLSRHYKRFAASKISLNLSFQNNERFFKVVPMRRRSAARRHMHVNQAESAGSVFARQKNCVGVSDKTEMRRIRIVRSRNEEISRCVIEWQK